MTADRLAYAVLVLCGIALVLTALVVLLPVPPEELYCAR